MKIPYAIKKPSGQDRTATERNNVAEATRRRRRILQAGFFLVSFVSYRKKCYEKVKITNLLPGKFFCDLHVKKTFCPSRNSYVLYIIWKIYLLFKFYLAFYRKYVKIKNKNIQPKRIIIRCCLKKVKRWQP